MRKLPNPIAGRLYETDLVDPRPSRQMKCRMRFWIAYGLVFWAWLVSLVL